MIGIVLMMQPSQTMGAVRWMFCAQSLAASLLTERERLSVVRALRHIHLRPLLPRLHLVRARAAHPLEPQSIKAHRVVTKYTMMSCHHHPSLKHRPIYPKHGTNLGFTHLIQLP